MSSSYSSSRSLATHRRAAPPPSANDSTSLGSHRQDVDPAPTPRPIFQCLGFGFIIFLVFLQFRPATHFRHPSDPLRNWTPFDNHNAPPPSTTSGASSDGNSSFITNNDGDDGMVHVVSWMDFLDLRLLAVLSNSTLSSSRKEENDDYPQYCKFDGLNVEALNEEDRVSPCIQRLDKLEKLFKELSSKPVGKGVDDYGWWKS